MNAPLVRSPPCRYSGRGADRDLVTAVARALEPLRESFAGLSGLQMEEVSYVFVARSSPRPTLEKIGGGDFGESSDGVFDRVSCGCVRPARYEGMVDRSY